MCDLLIQSNKVVMYFNKSHFTSKNAYHVKIKCDCFITTEDNIINVFNFFKLSDNSEFR